MQSFDNFNLSPNILKGVREAEFTTPSPIQQEVIPFILQKKDVIAQAHTGTGKTAAFGLPLMSMIEGTNKQVLVIAPTRELAMQVSDELYRLGKYAGIKTAVICGGQSYTRQKAAIDKGVQIITATPGRLLDLLESGGIRSFNPEYVVLDEADEMLDMGFLEDIREIFNYLPKERQTLLFSATIPKPVEKLACTLLKDPVRVNTKNTSSATNHDIDELYYIIEEYERDDSLIRLIDFHDPLKAIIFTRTKKDADRVSTALLARGYSAKCLHGDLSQPQREEVIKSFRKGDISLLTATDVASRGLDIQDVSHVFNYHLPFEAESYVHRVGRTGRAGNKGVAITLVTPQEYRGLTRIKKVTGSDISYKKVPSLSEARQSQLETIKENIRNKKQSKYAISLVDQLEKDMDLKDLAIKLASTILDDENFTGPENIGVAGKKLERLQNESNYYRKDSNSNSNDRYRRRDKVSKPGYLPSAPSKFSKMKAKPKTTPTTRFKKER